MTDFTYKGEALLLSWSDSSAGRKVTFLLPDEGEEHPFKGFKCGPVHGQTFGVGCKEVTPGESEPEPDKPKRDYKESQICAMYCKNGQFQEWLAERFEDCWLQECHGSASPEVTAARVVKRHCGMESRRALDSDPEGEPLQRWLTMKARYLQESGQEAERTR